MVYRPCGQPPGVQTCAIIKTMTKKQLLAILKDTAEDEPIIFQLPFASPPNSIGNLKYVGTARYDASPQRAETLGIEPYEMYTIIDFEEQ
jgi:hypothetical protein